MSAPPIGMISSTPSTSDSATISQKIGGVSVSHQQHDQHDQRDAERRVDEVAGRAA